MSLMTTDERFKLSAISARAIAGKASDEDKAFALALLIRQRDFVAKTEPHCASVRRSTSLIERAPAHIHSLALNILDEMSAPKEP